MRWCGLSKPVKVSSSHKLNFCQPEGRDSPRQCQKEDEASLYLPNTPGSLSRPADFTPGGQRPMAAG